MSHYFTSNNDDLKSLEKNVYIKIKNQSFSFLTDHGVFSKKGLDFGSRLLIESVLDIPAKRVLDLGCGFGPIGIIYQSNYPEAKVLMVDVNDRAVKLAIKNSKLNKVKPEVKISDGFNEVNGQFDLILSNPPIRAGKKVIYRFFEDAKDILTEDGLFIFVINKNQGAPSAIKKCETIYDSVEVINKKSGYYIIKCRN
jgi:16S rRNA (guanine1207-N2)-methyltransferase